MIWTRPQLGKVRHRRVFCWFPLQLSISPLNSNHYVAWLCHVWVEEKYQTVGTTVMDTKDCWCIVKSQLYEFSEKDTEATPDAVDGEDHNLRTAKPSATDPTPNSCATTTFAEDEANPNDP